MNYFIYFTKINESVNSRFARDPSGNCGASALLVSPGGEVLANFARAEDRAFANSGATSSFWHTSALLSKHNLTRRILLETYADSKIGSSVKDGKKLVEVF